MSEREWSAERGAEKIRKIAAALVTDGGNDEEAFELVNSVRAQDECMDERRFDVLLREVLCWDDQMIAEAKADVYGDASAKAPEPVVRIEILPRDDGDELGLLSEVRAELKRMMGSGAKSSELQFCSGAVRITRDGFDA